MSSTTTVPPGPYGLPSSGNSLTEQILKQSQETPAGIMAPSRPRSSPSKPRSLSDAPKPTLSPSPAFREPVRTVKDDTAFCAPITPKRPNFPVRGLSLQMPPRDVSSPTSNFATRVPLSPKLDSSNTYGAPAPMLPRRSRGLEFARACTNLHHSTLAESSPDSSPTIAGRGLQIPQRKSLGSNSVLDSPSNITGGMWSTMPHSDRAMPTSSVSSINMLDSDTDSTASSEDEPTDRDMEDPMLSTPQVSKMSNNFISGVVNSPGADWMRNQFSPAAASLMSFQRARMRKGRSTHSSSSGNSSKFSPGPLSPPLMKSIEHTNGNYFQQGLTKQQVQSRRESLSLGTGDLHLSDSGDEEGKTSDGKDASGNTTSTSSASPRGVIRRPVTRRSNLLPKTKTFARIRAALLEEAAPVENEAKREADVIHQVRESDPAVNSPTRQSTFQHEGLDTAVDDDIVTHDATSVIDEVSGNFSRHAEKNSDGLRFWDSFEQRHRTPPPSLLPRKSSLAMGDDLSMDSTNTSQAANSGIGIFTGPLQTESRSRSRSSTPLASNAPTAGEAARKANNRKRGRDDDLDPSSFKRRAVSPGISVQSSPVLQQSPGFNGDKTWAQMPPPKTGNERSNSGGGGNPNKRVGLQGIVETNDGLMNMSIE